MTRHVDVQQDEISFADIKKRVGSETNRMIYERFARIQLTAERIDSIRFVSESAYDAVPTRTSSSIERHLGTSEPIRALSPAARYRADVAAGGSSQSADVAQCPSAMDRWSETSPERCIRNLPYASVMFARQSSSVGAVSSSTPREFLSRRRASSLRTESPTIDLRIAGKTKCLANRRLYLRLSLNV